jgi:hypothetical protein
LRLRFPRKRIVLVTQALRARSARSRSPLFRGSTSQFQTGHFCGKEIIFCRGSLSFSNGTPISISMLFPAVNQSDSAHVVRLIKPKLFKDLIRKAIQQLPDWLGSWK